MGKEEKNTGKTRTCCQLVLACVVTGVLVAAVMVAIFIPVMHLKERHASNKLKEKSKDLPSTTTPNPNEESTANKIKKGVDWLLAQRNSQWGWTKESMLGTAEGIIAVQLARPGWCCKSADSGATVNQMKLDILNGLLAESSLDTTEWYGGKLGMYVTALSLTCNDPERSFHRQNLTTILRRHLDNFPKYDFNHMFAYSWAIVGLCSTSNGKIDETYVNRLISGMKEDFTINSTDAMGMSVQALVCVKPRTSKIQQAINWGVSQIRKELKSDGSFGNQYTTALAYQALIAAEALPDSNEERRIVDFLFANQGSDGSFSSIPDALQVLPALSKKTLSKINTYSEDCKSGMTPKPTDSGTVLQITIQVQYSIFNNITSDKRDVTRYFTVPNNSTFYEVMVIASKEDNRYRFTEKQTTWGRMITSLSGIVASSGDRTFWSVDTELYKPASLGVEGLRVTKNDHIIMRLAQY